MRLRGPAVVAGLTVMLAGPAGAAPMDQDFFTDFAAEANGGEDPADFRLGPGHFQNGDAFFVGVCPLYAGDLFAWTLGPGGTSRVDFDEPMEVVEFRAVGFDGAEARAVGMVDGPSTIDVTGTDINDPSQLVGFTGEIDAIVFENTSGNPNPMDFLTAGASIDDFGFTPLPVPEPGRIALALLGAGVLLGARRWTA